MARTWITRLDRIIGLRTETEADRALMAEKLRAFIPRMPWLYAVLSVNLTGLLISLPQPFTPLTLFGVLLLVVMAGRLVHWYRLGKRQLTEAFVPSELRRVFIIAVIVCVAYCAWALAIYLRVEGDTRNHLILFGSLASLGCSFALTPLPSAARVPLFVLGMPLAVVLISSGDIAHSGMGLSLLTLIFVTIKLVEAHDVNFTRLVHSRLDVELEKQRAELAEREAIEERSLARTLSETDFLTGLANRRALLAAIERQAHRGGRAITVALLDLDGFKPINDTFGHATGDELLVEVSRRLRALVDSAGLVARLGGDEFAVLLHDCKPDDARALVEEAVRRICVPFAYQGRNLVVSACAGIASPGSAIADPMQAVRMADIALFAAKRKGRGQLEVFSSSLEQTVRRRAEIELALRSPGVERDIDVAFQPIIELATMKVCSFEALARWRHSDLGWIEPSEFIPITEQISSVEALTEALLGRAANEAKTWPDHLRLSFNLSAVHLCSTGTARHVLDLISAAGLPPERLQIEVTETALLADFDAARRNLSELRRHRVKLVLDDFGAGYASISYLREMRFDAIKLDGSLITAAARGASGLQLLKGVLDLCGAVGLPCIAEHVETAQQVLMLRELGCRFGQGYWLSRPMDADSARLIANAEHVPPLPALKAAG